MWQVSLALLRLPTVLLPAVLLDDKQYGQRRVPCIVAFRLGRAALFLVAWMHTRVNWSPDGLTPLFVEATYGNLFANLTCHILWKYHVPLHTTMIGCQLLSMLIDAPRLGLRSFCTLLQQVQAVGEEDVAPVEIQRMWASSMATYTAGMLGVLPEYPKDECRAVLLYLLLTLGTLLPSAVMYLLELRSRRAWLHARGLLPPRDVQEHEDEPMFWVPWITVVLLLLASAWPPCVWLWDGTGATAG